MTAADILAALAIPAAARVDKRVPKNLLAENAAPTAADKRRVNRDIEELTWRAALRPANTGVPLFRDDTREYLEIAVISLTVRPAAKVARIIELAHRAIPYPVFLILTQDDAISLSLAHLRHSQGQAGKTVLDGPIVTARLVGAHDKTPLTRSFLATLALPAQPRRDLHALYQGWIERLEARAAAAHTGRLLPPPADPETAARRRAALAACEQLTTEIARLRARAAREKQLNRRVETNMQIKQLQARLAAATHIL